MNRSVFAIPLMVLMLAGNIQAHAEIGGYNDFWRSGNCGGNSQYMSYTIWGNAFSAYDSEGASNSFSYQLNVLVIDANDPLYADVNYWVQVVIQTAPNGVNTVSMEIWNESSHPTGTNPHFVFATSFSHYFVVGDQVWIGLANVGGDEIEGSVVVENVHNTALYYGSLPFTFSSWAPMLVSAYEGLYGLGNSDNTTFTWHDYTGNDYMTYQYLYTQASSPTYTDYYAEGCYGHWNLGTAEGSNLNYGNVDEDGQYLFYSFG